MVLDNLNDIKEVEEEFDNLNEVNENEFKSNEIEENENTEIEVNQIEIAKDNSFYELNINDLKSYLLHPVQKILI